MRGSDDPGSELMIAHIAPEPWARSLPSRAVARWRAARRRLTAETRLDDSLPDSEPLGAGTEARLMRSTPLRTSLLCCSLILLSGCADDSGTDRSLDASVVDASASDGGVETTVPDAGSCASACAAEALVCNQESGACVECLDASHCDGVSAVCVENECQACAADVEGCQEPEPEPEPGWIPIRFATYNVRTSQLDNGAWGDARVGFDANDAARMARVADTIAAQRLTVVAVQEVHAPERSAILERLRTRHGQRWSSTDQRSSNDSAVLFRRDEWRLDTQGFFATPVRSLGGGGPRTRYQVRALLEHVSTGRRVWFYSVHFSAGAEHQDLREEAARRTVESIESRRLPFVLGGDFNTAADSSVGRVFERSGLMKYTRRAADRVVNDHCATHNSRAGSAGHQSCPGAPARQIDHVWVSRSGTRVRTHRVTASARTSRASDHNPVTAILELRD